MSELISLEGPELQQAVIVTMGLLGLALVIVLGALGYIVQKESSQKNQ